MNKKNFYLTTAIAYTNGKPHLGHALEFVLADAICRFKKLSGYETYFQTGTDEFGSKMADTALTNGVSPQELADHNSVFFADIMNDLNVKYDNFIRTSSEKHQVGARAIWLKMLANDDIYKGTYEGLYCSGCEAYLNEKDLSEAGECVNHLKKPSLIKEENYFFRLSKYNDQIRDLIKNDTIKIYPESRKNEMLSTLSLDGGLTDISFSRPKSVLDWGVTVPNDENHVMYVWCDALSNYITGLGFGQEGDLSLFDKFWPADLQIIGKDILRFHAGIWIGMLMSAGLSVPRGILVHGFITSGGQKMSKSLGNVVDPKDIIAEYGEDAFRYYLLKEIPTMDDGDFTLSRFIEVYEADLANNIGNLVSRVLTLLQKYNEGKTEQFNDQEVTSKINETKLKYDQYMNSFDVKKACEEIISLANYANKYIEDTKPWLLAKTDQKQAIKVLSNLTVTIRAIAILLQPILPLTAQKILANLGITKEINLENLTDMSASMSTARGENLFPKRSS